MTARYLAIALLFLAVAVAPAVLDPYRSTAAPTPPPPPVPDEALEAMEQGRYWRASRILRGYLAAVPDTTPETILLAAQAEAGWGGWSRVDSLLAGQPWLDSLAGGYGWSLLGRSRLAQGEFAGGNQALARYLDVAAEAGDRERGMVEVRRGLALRESGEPAEAAATLERAAELLPQIGDWLQVLAAGAAAEAGDTAAVKRLLSDVDPVLAREWGWEHRVTAYRVAGDTVRALEAAEVATRRLASASRRAAAWEAVGELRALSGDENGARAAFHRAMEAAPGSVAAVHAARRLSEMPGLTPDEWLQVGRLYLRHGNTRRGAEGLERYLASGRGSAAKRAQVRLELGRALFRGGRYRRAEALLLELADEAPSVRVAAEAMYLAGRAQYRQGRDGAGRATFLRTAERFPEAGASARAMFLVADLDHDDGRLGSAREFYRRAIEIRPSINESGLAMMRLGGLAFADGDYRGAAEVFEDYRRRYPDGRRYEQATYWAAKAYRAMGRRDLARARLRELRRVDPFSYYGLRAADYLGQDFWDVELAPSPPRNPDRYAEIANAVARVDILRELGLDDAAVFEVERLKEHFLPRDGALYALAEALNARGYTLTGISLGWEIYRREGAWNVRLLKIVYPFPYKDLILAEAAEQGLDPFFVAGLIRQESMFKAAIESHAGAVGLMQIIPRTGRALARKVGLDGFRSALLERPEINLHLGVTYLNELMARFDGSVPAVLAAYNAGPHRVNRWEEFPEFRDEELFAERIPYAETRHYVKVVQKNARIYAALYGEDSSGPPARRVADDSDN